VASTGITSRQPGGRPAGLGYRLTGDRKDTTSAIPGAADAVAERFEDIEAKVLGTHDA